MGRKKKFEEGTADAFRLKKDLSKITIDDAKAIMKELDDSYQIYRKAWDEAKSKEEKDRIEKEYLSANEKDLARIKEVGKQYWELIPGLRAIIDDVYFNMKYTQMLSKREIMKKEERRR